MKKTKIITSIIITSCLLGCNNISEESESKESNINISSEDTMEERKIFTCEKIEIGINETFHIGFSILEEYMYSNLKIIFDENEFVSLDKNTNIIKGNKLGNSKIKVGVDELYYDEIDIFVKDDTYMKSNFTTEKGRLALKTFTVMGASNSDTTTTAYPNDRPTFWCEKLVEDCAMTLHNYAKSGSTGTYCEELISKSPSYISYIGTALINNSNVIESIKQSDFLFFNYGGNEFNYRTTLGKIGDINDENSLKQESIIGALSYIIDKAYQYNPNIKIVILGLTTSTWGFYNSTETNRKYAKTKEELMNAYENLASEKNCKYIDTYNLWDTSKTQMDEYCKDGIHMTNSGHYLYAEHIYKK